MTDLKISALPSRTEVALSDEFPSIAGGVNYRTPLSAIIALAGEEEGAVVPVSDVSYTLTDDDNGKLLCFTNPNLTAIIIPDELSFPFRCRAVQVGGQITFIPDIGVLLNSANSKFSSVRYVLLELVAVATNSYLLFGQTVEREVLPGEGGGEAPANTALPGIIQNGFAFTADKGIWTNEPREFFYAWYRDVVAIDGAVEDTYGVVEEDIQTRLSVAVTAVNDFGETTATSPPTDLIVGVAPANVSLPTISGGSSPPQVGQTLIASIGSWTGIPAPVFTYQWRSGGVIILGEIQSTYRITANDISDAISVTVTATNSQGAPASATSAATAVVVAGTAEIPVLSLFTVDPAPQFGDGWAQLAVTTTVGDGIFWWVVINNGLTAPNAAQIRAGTDGNGNPAVSKGSIEVASIETWGNNPSGLSSGTVYDAYGVMYNSVDQASNVVTDEFTMGGSATPTLSTQLAFDFCDVFARFQVTTNNGNGILYVVVVPELDAAPSAAQIKAGTNSAGAAAPKAQQTIITTGTKRLLVTGLTAATGYKAYFVQEVPAGFSNTPAAAFRSDTLLKALITDGTMTGWGAGVGSEFTTAQPSLPSGNNAIKWADNNDGEGVVDPAPPAAPINAAVLMAAGITLFSGVAKYHFNVKWESGAEWMRVFPANVTRSALLHVNVRTGEVNAGTTGTVWIDATSVALGSGWFAFSGKVDHAPPPDFTGTPDFAGALNLYMSDADGAAFVDGRDGMNIRYMHDMRITRATL